MNIRSSWGEFNRRWDWQTWQENLGGGLFNAGPHAIDQALALFGWSRTPKVFCRMDCNNAFGADGDDHCTVTLYDSRRWAPQIDIIISGYLAYPPAELYNVSGGVRRTDGRRDGVEMAVFQSLAGPRSEDVELVCRPQVSPGRSAVGRTDLVFERDETGQCRRLYIAIVSVWLHRELRQSVSGHPKSGSTAGHTCPGEETNSGS